MRRWTATWRPSELDYLVQGDDLDPLIVVRPRGQSEDALALASDTADYIVETLNQSAATIEGILDAFGKAGG